MIAREDGTSAAKSTVAHDGPPARDRSRATPPRALGIAVAVAGAGLILDQGTKALALAQLQPGHRVPLVGDLLGLSLVSNPGAAFSIGSGATWVFTVAAVIAVIVTLGFATRLRGARWGITLGLILGGAAGNLVDRLVNPPSFGHGHVTDFIAYGNLFVGNVADILVLAGVALLCLLLVNSDEAGIPQQRERRSRPQLAAHEGRPFPRNEREA
ncbi:signal peptidase II [Agrococcus carbonis]|uniref:Lipoprotein signal peptidase n=1 Tax=Agrococcus carbonis TaxID=684552 RepID=A0A1H1TFN0_9MICO|nr:signal peptidase II [Agrococcus carbonis]SDR65081.1 signal peptidase II [Agrococcus carbonis]SDS59067.1 signal peptidase II [Agrococcus carbonis]